MTTLQLTYLHLATILPAFLIGTVLMLRRKGTRSHKSWGKIFLALMLATAVIALFLPATVGPRWLDHFGFIHLFCILVFVSAPTAVIAARSGNIRAHRRSMIGLYTGAVLIAGIFAFTPGRMLNRVLHGQGFNALPGVSSVR